MIRRTLVCAALVLASALPASGTPLTWTLQNVSFLDGTAATGSFEFDADIGLYSAVSISMSSGVSFDSTEVTSFGSSASELEVIDGLGTADLTGHTVLLLVFSPSLTDLGGTAIAEDVFFGSCADSVCGVGNGIAGTGIVVAPSTPVPEPTTLLLLGTGLCAGGVRRWQMRQRA